MTNSAKMTANRIIAATPMPLPLSSIIFTSIIFWMIKGRIAVTNAVTIANTTEIINSRLNGNANLITRLSVAKSLPFGGLSFKIFIV